MNVHMTCTLTYHSVKTNAFYELLAVIHYCGYLYPNTLSANMFLCTLCRVCALCAYSSAGGGGLCI